MADSDSNSWVSVLCADLVVEVEFSIKLVAKSLPLSGSLFCEFITGIKMNAAAAAATAKKAPRCINFCCLNGITFPSFGKEETALARCFS